MKMGGLASPFGVDADRAAALVKRVIESGAEWRGLHIFAGSQVLAADALIEAQRATVALAGEIADAAGAEPPEVNLGGGFGIPYFPGEQPLDIIAVGAALAETLVKVPDSLANTRFAIELGRWLVGEAGVYLTRIIDRKKAAAAPSWSPTAGFTTCSPPAGISARCCAAIIRWRSPAGSAASPMRKSPSPAACVPRST